MPNMKQVHMPDGSIIRVPTATDISICPCVGKNEGIDGLHFHCVLAIDDEPVIEFTLTREMVISLAERLMKEDETIAERKGASIQ